MNGLFRRGVEALIPLDASEWGAPQQDDTARLLEEQCVAPGCCLRNGDHSPEETTACLERWLVAHDDPERRP